MDYKPTPITLRQVHGLTIAQVGCSISVDGLLATVIMIADVQGNSRHFMRAFVDANAVALKNANAVALVAVAVNGSRSQVTISAAQYALGQPERTRYADWVAGNIAQRAELADKYDREVNEGEAGDNPHRGPHRLGGAFKIRERHYPEGA